MTRRMRRDWRSLGALLCSCFCAALRAERVWVPRVRRRVGRESMLVCVWVVVRWKVGFAVGLVMWFVRGVGSSRVARAALRFIGCCCETDVFVAA